MKRLFKFKYPKLTILFLSVIAAYFLFSNESISAFMANLKGLSYLGVFLAGILFSFGFTTPFSIGLLLTMNPDNIFLAAIIGGFGALLSDLVIFSFIRLSFLDEFEKLEKTKPFRIISDIFNKSVKAKLKIYLLYIFAGIIISSPLPDEIGVTMLAGLTKIKPSLFALLSLIFNSLGILVILLI